MSSKLLETINNAEVVDAKLKKLINDVYAENSNTQDEEVIEFILNMHSMSVDELGNTYSGIIYDNIRKLERIGRFTSLNLIARAARLSSISALQNSVECDSRYANIMSETYELECEFERLSLYDKKRISEYI